MPIPLRSDYTAARLRLAARGSKNAGQTRRLLALAAIYDGASRTEAATIGGVTVQIIRDWVLKLNAGGPDALADYRGPGPRRLLTEAHRTALAQAVEHGPMPAIHGVVRWRVIDLVQWLSDEFQVRVSKQTLSRELRNMGYRRLSARPRHHAQAVGAIEVFKKLSPRIWTPSSARRASRRAV
jgi:transposase